MDENKKLRALLATANSRIEHMDHELEALNTDLAVANETIERQAPMGVEDQPARTTRAGGPIEGLWTKTQAENKRLRAELEAAHAEIATLKAKLKELAPKRDPWQTRVAQILADRHVYPRWTAWEILEELEVPYEQRDTDTYRRLSRVVKAIGGWKNSNNVADPNNFRGARLRGYIRIKD